MKRYKTKDIADSLKVEIIGSHEEEVVGVSPLNDIQEKTIVYIAEKIPDKEVFNQASVFLINNKLRGKINIEDKKVYFFTHSHEADFYKMLLMFQDTTQYNTIDRDEYSRRFDGVHIARGVVIEENVEIGEGSKIGANVFIANGTKIGLNTVIQSNVSVLQKTIMGDNCFIGAGSVIGGEGFGYTKDLKKKTHIGNVEIGDGVEIGCNTCVDRAVIGSTKIGSNTKIDNMVQIAHNNIIGESCLIVSQVGIAGSCRIGNNVTILGQVGIGDHVILEDNIKVYPRSAITSNNRFKKGVNLIDVPAVTTDVAREDFIAYRTMLDEYKKRLKKEREEKNVRNNFKN